MPSARPSNAVAEVSDVLDSGFETTPYHDAIFDWFANGEGHLRCEAFAGTGKTTTVLRAIDHAPEDSIWLATFGRRNREDIESRLDNPRATARTIHSLGYSAVNEGPWGFTRMVAKGRRFDREDALASAVTGGMPWGAKRLVAKLVTKARELQPLATTIQPLVDLAVDFDLLPLPGESLTVEAIAHATLRAMDIAAKTKPVDTGIDFADQLFLPVRNGWLHKMFDMTVVDEYQDLTLAQLLFVRAVTHDYGRIVLVGDRHQAIYRFRGAGGGEVAKLMANLRPRELALPKTYRCPKKVVEIATRYAEGYQVAETAPEGTVDQLDVKRLAAEAQEGDFILSRTNAPLASIALQLIREDKPCVIRGRDIAQELVSLIRRLTKNASGSISELLLRLDQWQEKEKKRLISMKRTDKLQTMYDKVETLQVLALASSDVTDLLARTDRLFVDNLTDGIVLSTVHKAKGLEAERVFLLRWTFLRPAWGGGTQTEEDQQEERNIFYVAVTRSKQHLTMVNQ